MSNSKYDFHGLDNQQDEEDDQEQDLNQESQNYTKETEILEDKTQVRTVIKNTDDLIQSGDLPEEKTALYEAPKTEDVSIFSCYQCNIANVKLLPIITEEQKRAYSCFKCISNDILDIHFEEFLNGNDTYIGVFHNYLDKQKA